MIFMFSHQLIILLITSATILTLFNAVTPLTDRIGVSSPYDFGKIRLWGSVGYAISAQLCGLVYDDCTYFYLCYFPLWYNNSSLSVS